MTSIKTKIKKNPSKRSAIVADAWVGIGKKPKFKAGDYDIEITDIRKVEVKGQIGVEIFARAWDKNGQIGFGKDGTVDIERFRFFGGLEFMVSDGTEDEDGNINHKEDVEAKVLMELEHTISVKTEKSDDSRIVAGKIGKTTSTLYPSADANDGSVVATDATWTTVRNASTGSVDDMPSELTCQVSTGYNITRPFVSWDTSVVGTDTISSLIISMSGVGSSASDEDTTDTDIVAATPANPQVIAAGDFDQVGSVALATLATANFTGTNETYYAWSAMSQAGIDLVNGSGFTTYAFRNSRDTDNSAPAGFNRVRMKSVNVGTFKPKMVIEHEVGVTDTGFLLMF